MESLRISLVTVAPLFLLMAIGYVIRLTGIMNETAVRQTNRAVFCVFLPLLVFQNVIHTDLSQSFRYDLTIYVLAGIALQFLLSLCIAFLTERENSLRGVMLQGMFRGNFVLFGIPICMSLFGEEAAGLAGVLTSIVIPLYNILAVISLELFRGERPNIWKIFKGIITNPLIIASLFGVLCLVFRFSLPPVIESTVSDLAGIATPLAFVLLGASFSFKEVGSCIKALCVSLSVKLLFFPILFLGLAILLGFQGASLTVLLVLFASPVAVSSFTMAQQMGGDERLASQLVVFSSLLSVFTLFLFIFLLKQFSFL